MKALIVGELVNVNFGKFTPKDGANANVEIPFCRITLRKGNEVELTVDYKLAQAILEPEGNRKKLQYNQVICSCEATSYKGQLKLKVQDVHLYEEDMVIDF